MASGRSPWLRGTFLSFLGADCAHPLVRLPINHQSVRRASITHERITFATVVSSVEGCERPVAKKAALLRRVTITFSQHSCFRPQMHGGFGSLLSQLFFFINLQRTELAHSLRLQDFRSRNHHLTWGTVRTYQNPTPSAMVSPKRESKPRIAHRTSS